MIDRARLRSRVQFLRSLTTNRAPGQLWIGCNSVQVDSPFGAVLDNIWFVERVTVLSNSAIKYGTRLMRTSRGIAAVFLIVVYMLSGALHQLLDMDVTAPGGNFVSAMSETKDTDKSGKGIAAEHHCHGCFSVSVPAPVVVSATIEPKAAAIAPPLSRNTDLVPGVDTPPPKLLT